MRKPIFVIEKEKKELFLQSLKPITNWNDVKRGELIFHESSNSIHNADKFIELAEELGIEVVKYINSEGNIYTMSKSGWYYFDEDLENKVNEQFIPKLYKYESKVIEIGRAHV